MPPLYAMLSIQPRLHIGSASTLQTDLYPQALELSFFKRTIITKIMMRDYVLIPPFLDHKSCDLGENWGQMYEKRGA